ncbi:siroheme decarboxylase subunit beta [Desulfarculus baarsii]
MSLDDIDKKLIARLQGDLPLEPRPFAGVAAELGLDEAEVVRRVRRLADAKIMRRFGATLRHQRSGFACNVMVAWRAPADQASEMGRVLATVRNVSHAYHRRPCPGFDYNLFTMVHGRDEQECRSIIDQMAQMVGHPAHDLLFSVEELKKTSMRYFTEEGEIHAH